VRLGILGGTFDPIHMGHLAAARTATECAQLDRVVFIPSAQPPHRAMATASAADRLAMTRLAIQGEPRFDVLDAEVKRGGVSYTVDTLMELYHTHPQDELFLILGWDAARLFSTWHQPRRVSTLAWVVIVGRPGTQNPGPSELAAAGLDTARLIKCFVNTPDISSSDVRELIAAGESVAGKVPLAVERYISSRHLYRDNQPVGT
jgi:nicotinate-nucleotide adenylyltransferase